MAKLAKLLQAAAGAGGGGGLNIEDVFSTYLVELTASTSYGAVTNNIDLSGEGGLVWEKARNITQVHRLYDTERGATKLLKSDSTAAEVTASTTLTSFNSDGFTIDYSFYGSDTSECFWTFRKAPKFFDVVTYTGNGTSGRTVSHNLGTTVGTIIVKRTDSTSDWRVFHRSLGATAVLRLNSTAEEGFSSAYWNDTAPTSTEFSLGSNAEVNASGGTYVAYLFAHNDGDGEFGPDGDADIIKCGSYTGNGSSDGPEIDLGFEPQWLIVKEASNANSWFIIDAMRGIVSNGDDNTLRANTDGAEGQSIGNGVRLTATGFKVENTYTGTNRNSSTYIYIAIRRGPMAVPEDAADVFEAAYGNASGEPAFTSNFPVDFGIWHGTISSTNENRTSTRLTQGKTLDTDSTDGEQTSTAWAFDYQDGFMSGGGGSSNFATMWRRAPNFFDVVAYTGTGSNQTISHNLGVAPKFMIVKERTTANNWVCYLEALGNDKRMGLNAASTVATDTTAWQSTTPTDSAFYVGANTQTNVSGEAFIAYLFGEVAGISKFGTYTGTGAAQNIDCGFSSGARFVLIKTYAGTNPNADWNIWDSERGIVAGNDPYLALSSASAEVTSTDVIDPYSSGFALTSSGVANNSGTSYWFYAIA